MAIALGLLMAAITVRVNRDGVVQRATSVSPLFSFDGRSCVFVLVAKFYHLLSHCRYPLAFKSD